MIAVAGYRRDRVSVTAGQHCASIPRLTIAPLLMLGQYSRRGFKSLNFVSSDNAIPPPGGVARAGKLIRAPPPVHSLFVNFCDTRLDRVGNAYTPRRATRR